MTTSTLANHTILMSGGSRGIGLAIAQRAAKDGANVALLAKTDEPDPRLEGTVRTAVTAIAEAGGRGLAIVGDVRNDADVARAIDATLDQFGGLSIVVNNASAIDLSPTSAISMKKYDLMHDVNARGTFLLSKSAIPHLVAARSQGTPAHILTLSPPLNLDPAWFGAHLAYTVAKYAMSMMTIGLAEELRRHAINVNSLWPRTTIATAAVRNLVGGDTLMAMSRTPQIMADAAQLVLTSAPGTLTGQFLIDEDVLTRAGRVDFESYRAGPGTGPLMPDLFL